MPNNKHFSGITNRQQEGANVKTTGMILTGIGALIVLGTAGVLVYQAAIRKIDAQAQVVIDRAAPAAGYQAGQGAVDAVFRNVETLLTRPGTNTTDGIGGPNI